MALMAVGVVLGEPEPGLHGRGAIAEQPHRLGRRSAERRRRARAATAEAPGSTCSPRTRSASRLVTSTLRRGQCSSSSTMPDGRRRDLFEVVEHQEGLTVAELRDERVQRPASLATGDAHGRATAAKASSTSRSALRSTKNTPSAKLADLLDRGPDRQPGLAGAARPRQRDEPDVLVGDEVAQVAELGLSAEERRRLGRQVVARPASAPGALADRRRTARSRGWPGRRGAGRAARRRRGTACTTRCPRPPGGRASRRAAAPCRAPVA